MGLYMEACRKEERQIGRKEGAKESKVAVVKNLLSRFGFTPEQAAEAAGLPLQFVQWIARQQLSAEQ